MHSPTSSATGKEKNDSITVTATGDDPEQQKPITAKLNGGSGSGCLCHVYIGFALGSGRFVRE